MDSFLSVVNRSAKGKLSLSCGDLTVTVSQYEEFDKKHNRARESSWPRFLRPKSSESMDRRKSLSSNELVSNIDSQLAEIREKLANFREQDMTFRHKMDSLNNSIGELASRCSMNSSTASEASTASDLFNDDDANEEYYEDDQIIEDKIESISKSFSSEVLDSIPTIKVTCYKKSLDRRRSSDPTLHESARLIRASMASERYSIYSTDDAYLWSGSDGELRTIV